MRFKFDGYRVQLHIHNDAINVLTRRGNDWTNRFRKIADDAWHIAAGDFFWLFRFRFQRGPGSLIDIIH